MKKLPIWRKGKIYKYALIDDADWDKVSKYKWRWTGGSATGYAQMVLSLHRFIMNPPEDKQIDHKNRDGLDCRKENLRVCTRLENLANRSSGKKCKSGYRGVYKSTNSPNWYTSIKHKGKTYSKTYKTKEEAYKAFCVKKKELFGEFALLT